jgi:hydroxymethylbilane synthase
VAAASGTLRIGSRGSALALRQTDRVVKALESAYPGLTCEVQVISTGGDRDKETSLTVLGGQGIFAKELQEALLRDEIDIAVHSVKDLTSELPEGLMLAAVFERSEPRDVLVSNKGSLAQLPKGSTVGTSSRRRVAQLKHARPDLEAVDLRGNVDTRLRKVEDEEVDAAILAAAGLLRMNWSDRITQYLNSETFVPAPGQGALGIECLAGNWRVRDLVEPLNDDATSLAVRVERTFLRAVGGGCTSPIGAYATVKDGEVTLRAMLAREDMTGVRYAKERASIDGAREMAEALARRLLREIGEPNGSGT